MVATRGSGWFLAPSLVALYAQVMAIDPERDRSSDGSIGDAAHAARKSDHNPDSKGIVRAVDLDEDFTDRAPITMMQLAENLRMSRDSRIKYVIYERRLFASYNTSHRAPWTWGPYSGVNAHDKHLHISILASDAAANDTRPWPIGGNVADHEHNPPPGVVPDWVSQQEWEDWCEFSRTNPDTADFDFYRYDWSWVFARTFRPLLTRVANLEAKVTNLQNDLAKVQAGDGGGGVPAHRHGVGSFTTGLPRS